MRTRHKVLGCRSCRIALQRLEQMICKSPHRGWPQRWPLSLCSPQAPHAGRPTPVPGAHRHNKALGRATEQRSNRAAVPQCLQHRGQWQRHSCQAPFALMDPSEASRVVTGWQQVNQGTRRVAHPFETHTLLSCFSAAGGLSAAATQSTSSMHCCFQISPSMKAGLTFLHGRSSYRQEWRSWSFQPVSSWAMPMQGMRLASTPTVTTLGTSARRQASLRHL